MPRFKHYNQGQTVLLPVSFDRQIIPGTFEHTLNYLVDEKLDLNIFITNTIMKQLGVQHMIRRCYSR